MGLIARGGLELNVAEIDPYKPDQRVQICDNPGRWGYTTGRTKGDGANLRVEVKFGPSDRRYKPIGMLCLMDDDRDTGDDFLAGRFGGASDLRKLLTYQKVRGELTSVFYSMEASNTDFYPHQFRPVLAFVESPVGRLLLADEVGLGKTIEALHIWRELEARQGARRLLVVCPAMLRTKWKQDALHKFGINARIVGSHEIADELADVAGGQRFRSWCLITSLEGVRPPRRLCRDGDAQSTRSTGPTPGSKSSRARQRNH